MDVTFKASSSMSSSSTSTSSKYQAFSRAYCDKTFPQMIILCAFYHILAEVGHKNITSILVYNRCFSSSDLAWNTLTSSLSVQALRDYSVA